ncbi:MAG: phenylalanine--tRNA ligase beta subunit-related protein [Prolixibacteraceae bacterium]|nr:phenylalanine--tRNA ligase beta subunit-related protein [Prolixibacteraceae bacterium]
MIHITVSGRLKERIPSLQLSCIQCNVIYQPENDSLWAEIMDQIRVINEKMRIEQISKLPAIAATRIAYKACGKDPARYRPSAEALLRRAVKHNSVFQINNIVDSLNMVSLATGFSIGGYDADKIEGNVVFDIGIEEEPYRGIGRGELNIEGLPVFRDESGAFGTPTSDSERTSVTEKTKRFLMVITDFGTPELLDEATSMATDFLSKYAGATDIKLKIVH